MSVPNCIVETQEVIELIQKLEAKYPKKSRADIKAEINSAANAMWDAAKQSNPGVEFKIPTMTQMEEYYAKRQRGSEPSVENLTSQVDLTQLDEVTSMVFRSTQQREDRVLLIARMFSEIASDFYEEAKGSNPDLSRRGYIVNNISTILEELKESFNPEYVEDEANREEFQKIIDCWEVLLEEVANILYTTESISLNFAKGELLHNEGDESGIDLDNMNGDEDSSYTAKDGWMVKARELDLRDTLSQETRKILNTIKRLDKSGREEVDDLGYPRYLNADYAHLKLLEEISKIYDDSQFDDALKTMAKSSPWVNQVIETLNANPSWKAKFYQDLRKEFVPYWIQTEGHTKQVNRTPGIFYLLQDWRYNYENGTILDSDAIYNNKNEIIPESGAKGVALCNKLLNGLNNADSVEMYINSHYGDIKKLLNMIGIDFTEQEIADTISLSPEANFKEIVSKASIVFNRVSKGELGADADLINTFDSVYKRIATLFNLIPQGVTIASFREGGKSYQSYSAPSYLGKLLNGIKSDNALNFLMEEFGRYRMFYTEKGGFRNDWLQKLASDKKYRELLERKVVLHSDKKGFDAWDDAKYLQVMLNEYFSVPDTEGKVKAAWYALPLLADAPSAEFLKFVRYTSNSEKKQFGGGFKSVAEIIVPKLADVALQEFERIALIVKRDEIRTKAVDGVYVDPDTGETLFPSLEIENWDIHRNSSGEITGLTVDSEGNILDRRDGAEFKFFPALNRQVDGVTFFETLQRMASNSERKAALETAISEAMETAFGKFVAQANSLNLSVPKQNSDRVEDLREFFYNNALAYTQIVRLTTTDLAGYKDLNDFQKRYKEVYAMTSRLYTQSKYGKPAERVVYLKDVEIKSNIYDSVKAIFMQKEGVSSEEELSDASKTILKQYLNVNVADAQAFRTLESYRSIMDMSGNWTPEMEAAYERLNNGNWSAKDFKVIWQTIKPFVFSQTAVPSGVTTKTGEDYGDIKMPTQHKNSEFLLLSLYETISRGHALSPVLNKLSEFMKANDIDMVQFKSAVKVGNYGDIDIMDLDSALGEDGKINPGYVHTISFQDYGIQQATPEHLLDHYDVIGTQFKKLIDADSNEDARFILDGKELDKVALHELYQSILSENILDSWSEVAETFSSKEEVAKALMKEMAGSTRYSDEERKACTLVDGVFQIPLYDPIQSNRIQQVLYGMIKKAINKQSIKRAACVQVSNIGHTDDLNIRFTDENGDFIFNQAEFEGTEKVFGRKKVELLRSKQKDHKTYAAYKASVRPAAIAYYEAYLPAYSKQFFPFLDNGVDGNFDINDLPEELRKVIGYRIPTEAKYSMQPIYIKGFLPSMNGSAIMLPSDITTIVGSDFDVDKVYLMLPEFEIQKYDKRAAKKDYDKLVEGNDANNALLSAIFDTELTEGMEDFGTWFSANKERYKLDKSEVRKIRFDYSKPASEQGSDPIRARQARNNAIIDIAWSVLTSESSAPQILKPGGFDEASRVAAICTSLATMSRESLRKFSKGTSAESIDKILGLKKKEAQNLAKISAERLNPLTPATQAYFHSQNSNGGRMIGVYAIGNASHSIGQWASLSLRTPFVFYDKEYTIIDPIKNADGELISENIANFLAASVDNVKDPVLKALNQDTNTGDITNFMLRLGIPIVDVGLFMNLPKLDTYSNAARVELNRQKLAWAINVFNAQQRGEAITPREQELLESILATVNDTYQVASKMARDLTAITQASRGDATNNGAGPTIGHNIVKTLGLKQLRKDIGSRDFSIDTNLLDLNFILDTDYNVSDMRAGSLKSGVPFIQTATKCGIVGPASLVGRYFPQFKPNIFKLITDSDYGLAHYINLLDISSSDAIQLINSVFNEFYLYCLRGTPFFGELNNTDDQKANASYYIYEFPKVFSDTVAKYPELRHNSFISSIMYVHSNKYSPIPSLKFTNTGNLSKKQKSIISKDWSMLLVSPNPEISSLGFSLFKYGTFTGLTYTPTSYIHLAPNVLRKAIPSYMDCMTQLMNYDGPQYKEFIEQYVRNHIESSFFTVSRDESGAKKSINKFSQLVDPKATRPVEGGFTIPAGKVIRKVEPYIDSRGFRRKKYYYFPFTFMVNLEDKSISYYRLVSTSLGSDGKTPTALYAPTTRLGQPNGIKEYYFGQDGVSTVISNALPERVSPEPTSSNLELEPDVDTASEPDFTVVFDSDLDAGSADSQFERITHDAEGNPLCL